MITKVVFGALIGGLVGALVGQWAKKKGGSCPISCSPQGGVLFGAMLGIMILMVLPPRTPTQRGGGMGATVDFTPSAHVTHITGSAEFEKALAENEVALVKFYTDTCGFCEMMKPRIHSLADAFAGRVAIMTVNAEESGELARTAGVGPIPDIRIYKGGKQQEKLVGLRPEADLAVILERLLTE